MAGASRRSTVISNGKIPLSKLPPSLQSPAQPCSVVKPPPFVIFSLRRRHDVKPELIEIDLASSSSNRDSVVENLENAFQRMMIMKSTPDWLPFLPGSSFWMAPNMRPKSSLVQVFNRMANRNKLTSEESLSFTTSRGWPCSSFYLPDGAYKKVNGTLKLFQFEKVKVPWEGESEAEMEVPVLADSDSEDEEE